MEYLSHSPGPPLDAFVESLTSTDPAAVTRLQKMAEAMRLMHEATSQ